MEKIGKIQNWLEGEEEEYAILNGFSKMNYRYMNGHKYATEELEGILP
jgi:hypothetical protein